MIRSMTAFARREHVNGWGTATWEIRSVNHRYLEVGLRLPDTVRTLEPVVRERIHAALARGKVDAVLKLTPGPGASGDLGFNRELAERLLALTSELEHLMGPGQGLQPIDVLRWPGVVSEPETDQDAVHKAVLDLLGQTLEDLVATRRREGERIGVMLQERLDAVAGIVSRLRDLRPQLMARLRDKLLARLADLPVQADSGRLEQELVLVAQRLDVDEELDRLQAHVAEIGDVLGRREPVGRRLDFLMQELNREANTLSSKSSDAESTRLAVDLKVLIEQMREQVQNVE